MRHPDPSELVPYVAGEPTDPGLGRHARACRECSAELGRLREAVGMLRTSDAYTEPGPGCLGEHVVAALAEGSLTPAGREAHVTHLAECTRCRAAVASVARALASERVGRELRALERGRRPAWLHYALPAAAAAAVLLFLLIELPPSDRSPHREGPITTTPAPVTIAPAGPVSSVRVLRWHPVAGADRYRVTLFDSDGVVLHEASLSDQVVALPDAVMLEPGRRYFWSVAARTGWDRWVTSELVEFSVTGDAGR